MKNLRVQATKNLATKKPAKVSGQVAGSGSADERQTSSQKARSLAGR